MEQFITKLIEFCRQTIIGNERGMYKKFPREIVKSPLIDDMIKLASANYCNVLYQGLILKNDPYINEEFAPLLKINNHSGICVLHFTFFILHIVHSSVDRKKLNYDNLDSHMESFEQEMDKELAKIRDSFPQHFNHECKGIDINTCDPNVPLFYFKY